MYLSESLLLPRHLDSTLNFPRCLTRPLGPQGLNEFFPYDTPLRKTGSRGYETLPRRLSVSSIHTLRRERVPAGPTPIVSLESVTTPTTTRRFWGNYVRKKWIGRRSLIPSTCHDPHVSLTNVSVNVRFTIK